MNWNKFTKSEDDRTQMVGILAIAGSVVMFVLMIILGFIWIYSGMGPGGLRGPSGTCNETCEFFGSAAKFSMWASFLLFPCGVIALARPWVRAGIVAGIALITVISFGWPALLVIGIALIIYAASRWVNR